MMNPYFEQAILNADPVELVRMLHQRAIASVKEAREHLRHGRTAERGRVIGNAYAAIAELNASLRPEVAPDLAGRLQSLYLYMQRRLLQANFEQSDAPLAEVLSLLTTLMEGWNAVSAQDLREQEPESLWSTQRLEREFCGDAVMA